MSDNAKHSPVRKIWPLVLPFMVLGIAVLIAYQISQSQPPASKGEQRKPKPLSVEVALLKTRSYQVRIDSFGVLEANARSNLFPLVAGQIIALSPDFEAGAHVKKGQVLLEIDPIEYEVNLQVAYGDLANSELALAEEQARYEQAQRDWKSSKPQTPASDFALRRPQLKAAQADLASAHARLKLAKRNLERTRIKAPYDGRVIEAFVNIGSVVNTSTQLAELYASESLQLSLPIANRDLAFIELPNSGTEGSTGTFPEVRLESALVQTSSAQKRVQWLGQIVGTEALIDAENQQLYALAKIVQPQSTDKKTEQDLGALDALRVGQYLSASIAGKVLEEVIMVPNSAVYQGAYVYIVEHVQGEDLIKRQPVSVEWRNADLSLIKTGLEPGQRLVTTLLGQVTSGTRVRIVENIAPLSDSLTQGARP